MDRILLEAARKIESCDQIDRLWEIFVDAIGQFALSHAIYMTVSDNLPSEPFVLSTLRDNWPKVYFDDPKFVEPFLAHCCATFELTKIGAEFLGDHQYADQKTQEYVRGAKKLGITAGLGFPCRLRGTSRHGGFILTNGHDRFRFEREILPHSGMLQSFCLIAHRRIEDLQNQRQIALKIKPLSVRERQTLTLIAQGQRPKQISHLLGVSVASVRLYLKNARAKLGAHTKEEAIVRMMELDDRVE